MIFFSTHNPEELKQKYIFIDNDFLSILFHKENVFIDTIELFNTNKFIFDPFTKFEFLRDIFVPAQYNIKEQFLNKKIFNEAQDHPEIYHKLKDNAIILSRIYAHNNTKTKSDVVDLFLASRIMYHQNYLLITGNKRHFPSCIFTTIAVLNVESEDSGVQAFSIIKFDKEKFDSSFLKLKAIK